MSDQPPVAVDKQEVLGNPSQKTQTEKEQSRAASDYGQSRNAGDEPSMLVKVHAPFREYYNGRVFSISAENATGPFDILPKHHNFISLLSPCDLVVRTVDSGEQKIRISGGIMHVKADQVIVFLDV